MPDTNGHPTKKNVIIRYIPSRLYPIVKLGKFLCVDVIEFTVDLKDRDPHNEYRDKNVQENSQFNEQRLLAKKRRAKKIDAVLQYQIPDYLS